MHFKQLLLARDTKTDLSAKAWAVLMVMCLHAEEKNAICFLKNPTIEEECRFKETAVKEGITELEKEGFITTLKKGIGREKPSTYKVHIEQSNSAKKGRVATQLDSVNGSCDGQEGQEMGRVTAVNGSCDGQEGQEMGRVTASPYKQEEVLNNSEDSIEVVVDACASEKQPTTTTTATPDPKPSFGLPTDIKNSDPDWRALQDVTGRIYGVTTSKKSADMVNVLRALRLKAPPSLPATPENIYRFRDEWKRMGRGRPFPDLICEYWDDVLNPRQPKENQNGNHTRNGNGMAGHTPRNSAAAERQRINAERRELLEQQGLIPPRNAH